MPDFATATVPPERTRLPANQRRASIVRAARREFARAGYQGASTASIARAAGCSEPILYKHFTGKQEIFAAVLEEGADSVLRIFDELVEAEGELQVLLDDFLDAVMQNAGYIEIMRMRALAVTLVDDPTMRDTLDRMQRRQLQRTERIVRRGIAEGMMRADTDPAYVSWSWQGLMMVGCYREALEPGGFAAMRPHVSRFLRDLRPPAPAEET